MSLSDTMRIVLCENSSRATESSAIDASIAATRTRIAWGSMAASCSLRRPDLLEHRPLNLRQRHRRRRHYAVVAAPSSTGQTEACSMQISESGKHAGGGGQCSVPGQYCGPSTSGGGHTSPGQYCGPSVAQRHVVAVGSVVVGRAVGSGVARGVAVSVGAAPTPAPQTWSRQHDATANGHVRAYQPTPDTLMEPPSDRTSSSRRATRGRTSAGGDLAQPHEVDSCGDGPAIAILDQQPERSASRQQLPVPPPTNDGRNSHMANKVTVTQRHACRNVSAATRRRSASDDKRHRADHRQDGDEITGRWGSVPKRVIAAAAATGLQDREVPEAATADD